LFAKTEANEHTEYHRSNVFKLRYPRSIPMIRTILYGLAGGFVAMVAVWIWLFFFDPNVYVETAQRWILQAALVVMVAVMVGHSIYRYRKGK
jgi:hypothetical protein